MDPRLPPKSSIDVHSKPTNMDSATWGLYLQQMFPLLQQANSQNLQVARQRSSTCFKRHYNVSQITPTYVDGTKVLVYFSIQQRDINKSFMHRWIGPFTIVHAIKSTPYLLWCDSNDRFTSAHVAHINPYATPCCGVNVFLCATLLAHPFSMHVGVHVFLCATLLARMLLSEHKWVPLYLL